MTRTGIVFPIVAVALFAVSPSTSQAQVWVIENDHPYDFRVIVQPRGGAAAEDKLLKKNGGRADFTIGTELHSLTTVQITRTERRAIDHDPIDVSELIKDSDVTLMSQIVTPLKVAGTEVRRSDGSTIYEAMPDFPTNEKYDTLLNELRNSAWTGNYGNNNQAAVLKLDGDDGEAGYGNRLANINRDRTTLRSVKYSAGDSVVYIAAKWSHQGQEGIMALKLDPAKPWQSEGFYVHGRSRSEGRAWRLGSVNIPVVVVEQASIVDSDGNEVKNVGAGEKLVVRQAARNSCMVAEPDGGMIGWIDSDSIKAEQ